LNFTKNFLLGARNLRGKFRVYGEGKRKREKGAATSDYGFADSAVHVGLYAVAVVSVGGNLVLLVLLGKR